MQATLAVELRQKALAWGVDLLGFAPVERFNRFPPEHRPTATLAEARTVIVLALHMVDPLLDLWLHAPPTTAAGRPSTGRAFEDEILRSASYRLVLFLERRGYRSEVAGYEPGIYLKDAAVLAGLGAIGRNNLLITPQFGPRVRLRAVITAAEMAPSRVMDIKPCPETCDRCIQACPVNALEGGRFNRERCLSSPLHRRALSPAAELWCNRCSSVCPIGIRVPGDETLQLKPITLASADTESQRDQVPE
jgi:epoxyqueuosine reductase